MPAVDEAGTIQIPDSEGGSARLRIVDDAGLLVSAAGAPGAGAADDVVVQAVSPTTIRLAWIGAPCLDRPELAIEGGSVETLMLRLDLGTIPPDVECPSIGVIYGVDLEFGDPVVPEDVDVEVSGE